MEEPPPTGRGYGVTVVGTAVGGLVGGWVGNEVAGRWSFGEVEPVEHPLDDLVENAFTAVEAVLLAGLVIATIALLGGALGSYAALRITGSPRAGATTAWLVVLGATALPGTLVVGGLATDRAGQTVGALSMLAILVVVIPVLARRLALSVRLGPDRTLE